MNDAVQEKIVHPFTNRSSIIHHSLAGLEHGGARQDVHKSLNFAFINELQIQD